MDEYIGIANADLEKPEKVLCSCGCVHEMLLSKIDKRTEVSDQGAYIGPCPLGRLPPARADVHMVISGPPSVVSALRAAMIDEVLKE